MKRTDNNKQQNSIKPSDLEMAYIIARDVREAGGRAYFVGGYVRDKIMKSRSGSNNKALGRNKDRSSNNGSFNNDESRYQSEACKSSECGSGNDNSKKSKNELEYKDIDIEVHNIDPSRLEQILAAHGSVMRIGAGFGVFAIRGYNIDIALPRMETNSGSGHKDFLIDTDPYIGTYKAAIRRDFTINAMMIDIISGQITDHFNGMEDLAKGILRHVDDKSFPEDPLRVLRAAQFAARFGFSIAEETVKLAKKMDLSVLPRERIMTELEKALLKAEHPSVFFNEMRKMDQLDMWFPEIKKLIGVRQSPEHHPEGDVWNHTMMVLDEAAVLRERAEYPMGFMMAALMHDLGKQKTTVAMPDGRIRSIGHENETKLVNTALRRLTSDKNLTKYVINMTRLHMRPNMLAYQKSGQKAWNRLLDESVSPADLLLLSKADYLGRGGVFEYDELECRINEAMREFQKIKSTPEVTGRDLINAGFTPGTEFKEILSYAHKLHLAGLSKETALKQITSEYSDLII